MRNETGSGEMTEARMDLPRIMLVALVVAALLAAAFLILRPFLSAMIWAAALVIATWPLLLRVQHLLWGRRGLAVASMTLGLVVILLGPLWFAVDAIVGHAGQVKEWVQRLITAPELLAPPAWLSGIPLIGGTATGLWHDVVTTDLGEILSKLRPYAGGAAEWAIRALGDLGLALVQFVLALLFAAVLYARGEAAGAIVLSFSRRLAGDRGERSVLLAMHATRSVALGVVVTAIVQAAIATLGLLLAGVPFVQILAAVTFILCLAQLGAGLVLIPAMIWMYAVGDVTGGTVLLVFSIPAMTLDNILRPLLIKRGAHLSLLLVLLGVFGGLLAFGLIGIFIGPIVLAVAYELAMEWIAEDRAAA
jgi:predicted PurR-regulated permease PerM